MGYTQNQNIEKVLSDEIEDLESEIDAYEHDLIMLKKQYEDVSAKNEQLVCFINRLSGEMLRNDFVLNEAWYDQAQQLIKSESQI